jgi:hypothetical protein
MQPEEGEVTVWPVRAEDGRYPRAWHLKGPCSKELPPYRAYERGRELPRDPWRNLFPVGVIPCVRVHLPRGLADRRISRLRPRTCARYVPTNEIPPVRALRIEASGVREWRHHRCEPLLDGTWHRPWAIFRSELREDHRALSLVDLPDGGQEVRGRKPSPMARKRCVNRHMLVRLPSGVHVRRWPAPRR